MSVTDNIKRKKTGQLTGPAAVDEWQKWRAARDKAIANPPRNKAAQELANKERSK